MNIFGILHELTTAIV